VSAVEQAATNSLQQFGLSQMVTLAEGEVFLRVSHSTMKNLIRTGKVRSVKIGGSRRILVDSLREIAMRGTE
jgi:hypothetical protein